MRGYRKSFNAIILMSEFALSDKKTFTARALLVGDRIETRTLESTGYLATTPLVLPVRDGGIVALFRYGVVVLFDVAPLEEATFFDQLRPFIRTPYAAYETEEVTIIVNSEGREEMKGGSIHLRNAALERLQLIADILAKSVVLARYELRVAGSFDRIEPLAAALEQRGQIGRHARELLQHIGNSLLIEHTMVGRVQVVEKPELLWEHPELERLYLKLEDEFEINERHLALERKLTVISRTAETLLDLIHDRRTLRVEWYVVALIVAEILLTLYEMFYQR
jgi:uncharacterized Rmd1/YagE family protein